MGISTTINHHECRWTLTKQLAASFRRPRGGFRVEIRVDFMEKPSHHPKKKTMAYGPMAAPDGDAVFFFKAAFIIWPAKIIET